MNADLLFCDNCGKAFPSAACKTITEVRDLAARLEPGSVVPDGECPACEALVYRAPRDGVRRVLVTVSGGVAYVDHCPPGVTVEVRDFDTRDEDANNAPTAWENGPGGACERVRLVEVLDADGDGFADEWRRADGARPEFDGAAPETFRDDTATTPEGMEDATA